MGIREIVSGDFDRLVDLEPGVLLPHGTVIRLLGDVPHERVVDLMVTETYDSQGTKCLGFLVSTGGKAGLTLIYLPVEAGKYSMSAGWLKANWNKWGYAVVPVDEVFVSAGYPAPEKLPDE